MAFRPRSGLKKVAGVSKTPGKEAIALSTPKGVAELSLSSSASALIYLALMAF